MKPQFYFNLSVRAGGMANAPSGTSIAVLSKALAFVHGVAAHNGHFFASAFPGAFVNKEHRHPGNVLRIFTQTQEACETIAHAAKANTMLTGYCDIGATGFVGPTEKSVEYRLFRLASRKSFAATKGHTGANGQVWREAARVSPVERRERRIALASTLPFLSLRSSSGASFTVMFTPTLFDAPASEDCKPNGYGFSTGGKPFRLPFIHEACALHKLSA